MPELPNFLSTNCRELFDQLSAMLGVLKELANRTPAQLGDRFEVSSGSGVWEMTTTQPRRLLTKALLIEGFASTDELTLSVRRTIVDTDTVSVRYRVSYTAGSSIPSSLGVYVAVLKLN